MTARRAITVFAAVALTLSAVPLGAQVSLTTLGVPYIQNFDTLPSSGSATWTNNSTIPGWFHARTGTGTTIVANNGSSNAGNLYSYGTGTATDRALGSVGSTNAAIGNLFWGVRLQNNTGSTITRLDVQYTGEQWRNSAAAAQSVTFSYLVGSPTVTGSLAEFQSAGVAVPSLDFTSPITGGAVSALDGNSAANRVTIMFSITGLSIPNGTEVMLRWFDPDHSGVDHGLSIDDFAVTPNITDAAPSVLTTSPPNGATAVGLAADIDVTFSEPVNVAPGWFTINCTVSGLHAASESGGPTTFTLDPTVDFVANEICTVTIDDVSVSDQDANDPPDTMAADFQWSFDTNPPPALVVNEIDYDQPGTDTAEFIEIRNNGATPVDLDPVAIELVNGLGATPYQSIDLPNVSLAPGAYYVICANNTITPNCNLDVSPNTNLIQNGAPDAVAIRWNGVLVDTVSYEGNTGAPYTETSGTGLVDDGGDDFVGISRFPDGGDTGVNNADLSKRCITPGAANTASTAPCSPPAILGLSIDDVAAAEGQAGTRTFTFTVRLDQPAPPGGVTFDIATADGTAEDGNPGGEDNDYVPQTLTGQTIPEGDDEYTFDVTVNSDLTAEPDETFFVNVTNVTGTTVGDPQAVGTIQNDDFASITLIHDIQGPGASSPEVGNVHTIHGIVTGVKSNGFFVQEEEADYDADPATSEGIFVFTSSAPPPAAQMGNLVYVTGTVAEFVPSGDPQQPPLTELTSATTVLDATGMALPAPVPLSATFPDPAGPHDQLERVEGMRVSAASITVTGPSDGSFNESAGTGTSNGRFHGVVTGVARPFREAGIQAPDVPSSGTIPPIPRWDFNPERLRIESATLNAQPILTVKSSDVVGPVIGPLDYAFRGYAIYPDGTSAITVTPGSLPTTVTPAASNEITVASFNMQRLFDDVDDPNGDPVPTTTAYDDRLAKASIAIRAHMLSPDIIGVQEVEKLEVLQDLAAKILADGGPDYDAYLVEGNDVGGIDVGFLVKTDLVTGGVPRVSVTSVTQEGAATQWLDPSDNAMHTLNDRPPLVLVGTVNRTSTVGIPIVVIVNHLRSLIGIESEAPNGLTTEGDRVRKKRQAQAEFLANYIQGRQTTDPTENIVVLGDFNAFEVNDGYVDVMNVIAGTPPPDNETVVPGDGVDLINPDLDNLVDTPPPAERYSYIHEGNAQNIDHVLVNQALIGATSARRVEHPRINADYPETERNDNATALRISDHDPVVAYFELAASADVSITKDLDTAGPFFQGQTISYTLEVGNTGPDPATNIQVTDTPANLTITNVSGACTSFSPCTIASLAPAASDTITVTATIAAAGAFDNSATATADESDPSTANNTDDTGNGGTATLSADVSLTATLDTPGPYVVGQTIQYTLNIANAGPSSATNIDVTISTTNLSDVGLSGACTAQPCTISSLAAGANTTITVTATIFTTFFDLASTALADEPDPDTSNNTDNTDNGGTAAFSADVSITKTLDTAGPYSAGQTIQYTLTVANAGPSTQIDLVVTDTPTNLTITNVSGACTSFSPCSPPNLNPGANATITVTATIDASGAFDNSASVTGERPDPDSSNNTDATGNGGNADASADVSMTATLDTAGPYLVGQEIQYTLTIANAGPSSATNTDVDLNTTNLNNVVLSGACTSLPCTIPNLAAGASTSITVTAEIFTDFFDMAPAAFADEPDPDTSNNTDDTGNGGTATFSADVSITKTLDTAGPYAPGQTIQYTLTVANAGPSAQINLVVTDTPANLTITNVSGACTSFSPCVPPNLSPGANATITVTATIDAAGTFDNSATVTGERPDPDSSNNTDATGNGGIADPVSDSDGDGVDDVVEQAAPNGGDGNGDGIPDSTQSSVASIPAATGSGYLTLQSSCALQEVYVTTASAMPSPDPGVQYPHGLIAFRAPCSSATFSLFVYGSGAVSAYRKFGPLPPGGPQQWYGIPATFGTATVGSLHPHRIDFSLTDGGTGDDTPVDGVIVDQGGPSAPTNIPTLDELALLALAAMLAMVALLAMKR